MDMTQTQKNASPTTNSLFQSLVGPKTVALLAATSLFTGCAGPKTVARLVDKDGKTLYELQGAKNTTVSGSVVTTADGTQTVKLLSAQPGHNLETVQRNQTELSQTVSPIDNRAGNSRGNR